VEFDNITIGNEYYFKTKATDQANNTGNFMSSDGFTALDELSIECLDDGIGPNLSFSQELTLGGVEIGIICEDVSNCNSIYYGISRIDEECNATSFYTSPIFITSISKVCAEAFDLQENKGTHEEQINVSDEDEDEVPDKYDQCPNTPLGEQVNKANGCSASQLESDRDRDTIPDSRDLCPDTPEDEIDNIDENGCAPSEKDSDNDGYGDNSDAFPHDSNEWNDSDGDGIGDNSDRYPFDYGRCMGRKTMRYNNCL